MDNSQYSPLTLAFLGDSVFELLVREALVKTANRPGSELHKEKLEFVSASAQADAFRIIESMLNEKELDIYRRGRNAHTNHTPKNMSVADYHAATGLEALFGYLYLEGESDRMNELFQKIWEAKNER
ncbi:MAG: ribonuclease III [Clostridia bacterium]|nr:ribonuclease III [Candidatus Limimonas egerieequi]MCQ2489571.1 ribonuclease III [Clostridia bacterium]